MPLRNRIRLLWAGDCYIYSFISNTWLTKQRERFHWYIGCPREILCFLPNKMAVAMIAQWEAGCAEMENLACCVSAPWDGGHRRPGEEERDRFEMCQPDELTWTPVSAPSHKRIPVLVLQPGEQRLKVVEQWSYIHTLCSYNTVQGEGPGFWLPKAQHLATWKKGRDFRCTCISM